MITNNRRRNTVNHIWTALREAFGRCLSFVAAVICLTAAIIGSPARAQTLTVGISAGLILCNPLTNKIYVGGTPLSVIDGATNTVTNIPGTQYGYAYALNTVTNKLYYIAGYGAANANLMVIDGATNAVSVIPLPSIAGVALAVNTTTNKIYIANETSPGSVTVVDGATQAASLVTAGFQNLDIAVNSVTNKIYVANFQAATPTVTMIDGATSAVTNITVPAALVNGNVVGSLMAVNTTTNKIYLASNPAAVIDGATNVVTKLGATVGGVVSFAYNPVTNNLYIGGANSSNNTQDGTVTVINGTTGAATPITVGVLPEAIAVDTATNTILVADTDSNQLTEINGATNATTTLPAANAPFAVAVNPATNKFYVLNSGNNTVTVLAGPVVTASPPTITAQPIAQTVATGSSVVFTAAVSGLPAPTLQWNLNGAPIPGASSAVLVVSNATPGSAGSYTLTATNPSGVATSSPVVLTVSSTTNPGRLINLSILSFIQGSLSMGFVTGGAGTSGVEPLLIRGVGPSIGPGTAFAVPGVMTDPTLTVVGQTSHLTVASNSGWGIPASNANAVQTADAATGAFALTNTSSLDSAVVANLPGVGGGYSATVAGKSGDNGWALTEVYDDTAGYTPASTRLVNLSCLTQILTGGTLDVGFVIGGATSKTVLVRVGGPALSTLYNIPGVMPDPQLQVSPLSNSSTILASNAGWGGNAQVAAVAASVGAYAFPSPSSLDSAALVTLPPGAYTVQVNSTTGLGGTVLVEIYDIP